MRWPGSRSAALSSIRRRDAIPLRFLPLAAGRQFQMASMLRKTASRREQTATKRSEINVESTRLW